MKFELELALHWDAEEEGEEAPPAPSSPQEEDPPSTPLTQHRPLGPIMLDPLPFPSAFPFPL
ncbi:MAG: hypothetical protein ACYTFG_09045 [Planctomycetota bacterium]|jgi:hypothetical protein